MEAQPIIEYNEEVYYINADAEGICAGDVFNTGFGEHEGLRVAWDDCYSLDEHIEQLFDLIIEQVQNEEN